MAILGLADMREYILLLALTLLKIELSGMTTSVIIEANILV